MASKLRRAWDAAVVAWRAAPPAPSRRPAVGETLWLDGRAHTIVAVGTAKHPLRTRAERVKQDAEEKRRISECATAELQFNERHGWWVLPGREGVMPVGGAR